MSTFVLGKATKAHLVVNSKNAIVVNNELSGARSPVKSCLKIKFKFLFRYFTAPTAEDMLFDEQESRSLIKQTGSFKTFEGPQKYFLETFLATEVNGLFQ